MKGLLEKAAWPYRVKLLGGTPCEKRHIEHVGRERGWKIARTHQGHNPVHGTQVVVTYGIRGAKDRGILVVSQFGEPGCESTRVLSHPGSPQSERSVSWHSIPPGFCTWSP